MRVAEVGDGASVSIATGLAVAEGFGNVKLRRVGGVGTREGGGVDGVGARSGGAVDDELQRKGDQNAEGAGAGAGAVVEWGRKWLRGRKG